MIAHSHQNRRFAAAMLMVAVLQCVLASFEFADSMALHGGIDHGHQVSSLVAHHADATEVSAVATEDACSNDCQCCHCHGNCLHFSLLRAADTHFREAQMPEILFTLITFYSRHQPAILRPPIA